MRQLSRAESAAEALDLVETDLRELVDETVERLRPQLNNRRHSLQVDGDGRVWALVDRRRVRQVLINVLDNAISYTPPGGRIEVEVVEADEGARIVAADTGIGIEAEHLPRVFERFYRAEPSRGRATGGTGVGLTIARRLVEQHGGTIELTSAPGEGTRVAIWLPRHPQRPADAARGAHGRNASSARR